MFCVKCGANLPVGSTFCTKCGAKMATDNSVQQPPNFAAPPTAEAGQVPPQDVSNNITAPVNAGGDLLLVTQFFIKAGNAALVAVAFYLTIMAIFGGSINTTIAVIGITLGIIGVVARVFDRLLGVSKILAFVVVGVIVIAGVVIAVRLV